MDFLDVSLAFPEGWHDIIDILGINSSHSMAEGGGAGSVQLPGQEMPSRHPNPPQTRL